MGKKRKRHFRKHQRRQHPLPAKKRRERGYTRGEKAILALFHEFQTPLSLKELNKQLISDTFSKKDISEALTSLISHNRVYKQDKKNFSLSKSLHFYEGVLEKHPKGFGFATQLTGQHSKHTFTKDPFLSPSKMVGAQHGDRILIQVTRVRRDGRPEAELITILERGSDRIIGFFSPGPPAIVTPEDPRFPMVIHLTGEHRSVQVGEAVIVKLDNSPASPDQLIGQIVEILGPPEDIDVQMRIVIEKYDLPHKFSNEALSEKSPPAPPEPSEKRKDLRDIAHVTIDGATAKDFDDAIAVIKTRKGFRLYVSIADVSHYVTKGSTLDKEAYQRGTSIYFPGRVIPMLPERLSNDLCSLVPNQDRNTFTAILDFDRQGHRLQKQFCKSVICSRKRFTYDTVKKILIDKDRDIRREHKEFLTPLKWASELATELFNRRLERGSIGFNIPEPVISLTDDGNIESISRSQRNFSHQIIEEFMLAANEAVATFFAETETDSLYRIHEKPSLEKVEDFKTFAKTLELQLPEYDNSPDWFGKVLSLVKEGPKEYVVNNLLLRTMQQARYDSDNCGHFGLAAEHYTHFTSPIRRYPDLLVHRKLEALLNHQVKKSGTSPREKTALHNAGAFLSQRERTAINAEREMTERLQCFFMEKHIGESFQGVISGVTDFALFVELVDLFISGSIDITQLDDDYYLHDSKRHRLIGQATGNIYSLGTIVKVTLLSVDHERRRINFRLQ